MCKDYQTPNLAKAINPDDYERVRTLDTQISDEENQYILALETKELEDRKSKFGEYEEIQKTNKQQKEVLLKRRQVIGKVISMLTSR